MAMYMNALGQFAIMIDGIPHQCTSKGKLFKNLCPK